MQKDLHTPAMVSEHILSCMKSYSVGSQTADGRWLGQHEHAKHAELGHLGSWFTAHADVFCRFGMGDVFGPVGSATSFRFGVPTKV